MCLLIEIFDLLLDELYSVMLMLLSIGYLCFIISVYRDLLWVLSRSWLVLLDVRDRSRRLLKPLIEKRKEVIAFILAANLIWSERIQRRSARRSVQTESTTLSIIFGPSLFN